MYIVLFKPTDRVAIKADRPSNPSGRVLFDLDIGVCTFHFVGSGYEHCLGQYTQLLIRSDERMRGC